VKAGYPARRATSLSRSLTTPPSKPVTVPRRLYRVRPDAPEPQITSNIAPPYHCASCSPALLQSVGSSVSFRRSRLPGKITCQKEKQKKETVEARRNRATPTPERRCGDGVDSTICRCRVQAEVPWHFPRLSNPPGDRESIRFPQVPCFCFFSSFRSTRFTLATAFASGHHIGPLCCPDGPHLRSARLRLARSAA